MARWRFAGECQGGLPGPAFCPPGGEILKYFRFLSDDERDEWQHRAFGVGNRGDPARQPLDLRRPATLRQAHAEPGKPRDAAGHTRLPPSYPL